MFQQTCGYLKKPTTVALLAAGLVALVMPTGLAYEPQLETDELLKPLVDKSQSDADAGKARQKGLVPVNTHDPRQPLVLTGKVQTLQEAIVSEKDTVNWYAWYLAAREYLGRTGGLQCPLGTPIKFHKDGRIEAISYNALCLTSVTGRHFPLPKETKLDALILPVRPGNDPPASPQEIYSRVESRQDR